MCVSHIHPVHGLGLCIVRVLVLQLLAPQMVNSPAAVPSLHRSSFQLTSYSKKSHWVIFLINRYALRTDAPPNPFNPYQLPTRLNYHLLIYHVSRRIHKPRRTIVYFRRIVHTSEYIFINPVLPSTYSTPRRVYGSHRTPLYILVHASHAGLYCTYKINSKYVRVRFPYLSSQL